MSRNGIASHAEAGPAANAWTAILDVGRYYAREQWLWAWLAGGFAALLANRLGRAGISFMGWSLALVLAVSAIAVLVIWIRRTGFDISHSPYLRRGDHLLVKVSGHWLDLGKVADSLYFDPDGRVAVSATITWTPPPTTT
jgi:hypothetical protein